MILALLHAGLVAGWDLGQGGLLPAGAALSMILASSGSGRRALMAGLCHALGGVLGLLGLYMALTGDSAGAATLLGNAAARWAGAALVVSPTILLAGRALGPRRGRGLPPGWALGCAATCIGLGGLLLCSSSAQLFAMLGNRVAGDQAAMLVSLSSTTLGMVVGPVPVLAYLLTPTLDGGLGARFDRVRTPLALAAALLGLSTLWFAA